MNFAINLGTEEVGGLMKLFGNAIAAVALVAAVLFTITPSECSAADIYWVGYQNGCMAILPPLGSWFHGDNWYNYVIPGSADVAILGSGFDPQDNGYPYTIYFGDFCTTAWPCPGSPVEVPGGSAALQALRVEDETWSFNLQGGGYLCNPPQAGVGSLHVLQDIAIGSDDPDGAWATISGGTVRCDGVVDLGRTTNGRGGLTIADGANMSVYRLMNGGFGGHRGELIVTGQGSTFSVDGPWDTEIGIASECTGRVTIEDEANMSVNHKVWIGRGGARGDMIIRSGGQFNQISPTSYFWIGGGEGDVMTQGAVSVTDAGSALVVPNELIVGSSYSASTPSTAVLAVGDGATVSAGKMFIGNGLASVGDVHAFGPGSHLQIADRLRVGTYGVGSLMLEHGASATCQVATIGWVAGSTGTVALSGSGTNLSVGNQLNVGWNGTGSLELSSGAAVSCVNFVGIGVEPGAVGVAELFDPYTTLSTIGMLVVGGVDETGGVGTLRISGDATVSAGNLYVATRGKLVASGTLAAAVVNAGEICPGDTLGRLHIANGYTQHQNGALRMQLGLVGGQVRSDTLSVAGTASLAGHLELALLGGYRPSAGTRFVIMTADSVSNAFSTVSIEGFYAHVEYGPEQVEIVFDGSAGTGFDTPIVATPLVNSPNPFNPSTDVRFSLDVPAQTRLGIYDIRGRLVCELIDEFLDAGTHEVKWDGRDSNGRDASSGCYFARLESGRTKQVAKLILAR